MKYFSQSGQDVYLDNLFKQQENGIFLDIGAYDGIKFSNTYFFEKYRNWTGVCVEANNEVFQELKKNRKSKLLNLAVSEDSQKKEFINLPNNRMLSGLKSEFEEKHIRRIKNDIENNKYISEFVECISFTELVNKFFISSHVDYCSIDVEGGELGILKAINFEEVHVSVFSIENTYRNSNITSLMLENGYVFIKRIGEDDIFILNKEL